jgi:cellulose synthase/poly-beta-1,6-N-acetylglucosamine synthase-like glycosyltransferase
LTFQLAAYVAISMCVTLLIFQATYVWLYRRWLASKPGPYRQSTQKCGVILCLRGADPSLPECLNRLAKQTYDNYCVVCVVDSVDDPSNPLVDSWLEKDKRFMKLVRPAEVSDSGLKNASLVFAIESLDPSFELIALIDADTVAHETWLEQLLAPFQDENAPSNAKVGATTGNRWFEPVDQRIGSWVRYVWNAAAVVQMYLYGITWGGSLGIRRKVLEETGLLDRWRKALCEDTMVGPHLRRHGWKLIAVPELMMVNREKVRLKEALTWIFRQLFFARLYHWRWWLVAGHGILLLGASWFSLMVVVAGLFIEDGISLSMAVLSIMVLNFVACGGGLILSLEYGVRQVISNRQPISWTAGSRIHCVLAGSLLLFFVQPIGIFWASLTKTLVWRGVRYRVRRPFEIKVRDIVQVATESDGHSL